MEGYRHSHTQVHVNCGENRHWKYEISKRLLRHVKPCFEVPE